MTPPSTATPVTWKIDWRLEWLFVVFSVESRVCLYANDGRTYVRRRPGEPLLPECISPQHRPHPRLQIVGTISYNSWSHFVFLQGKLDCARYIAQVVNPVLLPFIRQEGHVIFQQDNARPHTTTEMQHALRGVQQLPWSTRSPDLSPPTDHDEAKTYSFSRTCHNQCRIVTMSARCLGKSIAGWHSAPLWPFACENTRLTRLRCEIGVYCVLMWLFGLSLLWHVCFIWSEFDIIYSYNDKLLSHQFSIQWIWSWRCCIFPVVY